MEDAIQKTRKHVRKQKKLRRNLSQKNGQTNLANSRLLKSLKKTTEIDLKKAEKKKKKEK
ncbi:MAG: hypothetical protein CM15mP111_2050 [Hyphomicrobiales bacterium]|nr:MAG: hypothetical protein CM15mP111_2050 [Hyphomicrobiales bacterium]